MKTNVVMKSESDRNLFGIVIRQETKTGFLNLSDLQKAYEKQRIIDNWSEKRIDHIFTTESNTERIFYILKEQSFINVSFDTFMQSINDYGSLFKYLKKINVYKTTGARQTKTTWCNPYLWMLAALEMHPAIYGKTVIWLTDKLIINRIEAGNFYKGLTSAISKLQNVDYVKLAKALNYVVFGRHETGIRNFANQKELKELEQLEQNIAFAIDMGYIKTFDSAIDELRKMYIQKQKKLK